MSKTPTSVHTTRMNHKLPQLGEGISEAQEHQGVFMDLRELWIHRLVLDSYGWTGVEKRNPTGDKSEVTCPEDKILINPTISC